MSQTSPNRRQYIRVGLSLMVSYSVFDAAGKKDKDLIAGDISGGGIRLPLREKLAVGTLLDMQLEFVDEKKKILLEAKIAWVKPNPSSKEYPYEAGVEFVNIDSIERNMVSNCIQYLSREELLKEFSR